MKKTNGIMFAACCLTLFPALVVAAADEDSDPLLAEMDELGLYLGADQLVESATRNPKPINQVAENVTIITAEEIEAMNAHTVAEVLNRVTGLFVDGSTMDFGNRSSIHIQGSGFDHVLVLLDGMRWGYVSYDYPETNTIPVQIIKRIEVIKGPASSTWGSSLGGVVNIITKETGNTAKPVGTLSGTYGEHSTSDLRVDAAGLAGPVGYYLYAGRQESNGIRDTRFFDNQSFYGKLSLPLPRDMELQGTMGYSRPDYKYLYLSEYDDQGEFNDRVFYATLDFTAPLAENLTLNLAAKRLEDTLTDNWQWISTGEPYNILEYEGKSTSASGRLVWNGDWQTMVLGAEIERRENTTFDLLAPYTAPTLSEEVWAFYVNDTIRLDRLTITPGLRYDHLSIDDDILSPSLGLTYQISDDTLLRGSVGRGFRRPYPTLKQGDPYFDIINPNLESETIWSYQAGIETAALPFARLKASLFDHRTTDVWTHDPDTRAIINGEDFERQGLELEVRSGTFHNFSAGAGGMYVRMKPEHGEDQAMYTANVLLQYDDSRWRFQLFGHYAWLDDGSKQGVTGATMYEGEVGTFLWDAVGGYRFMAPAGVQGEIFAALHNIFAQDQYIQFVFPNAPRWLEAGLRFKF
ncbi:MAG: TonB-dependent receptor [Desulfobulbaceae bacterium]|nr:TonB-dependent receptor [Desulfobulbaceae bacterium]